MGEPEFNKVTSVFGAHKTSKIKGFDCKEYKLQFERVKTIENKGIDIFEWDEDEYFDHSITQADHERKVLEEQPDIEKVDNK